MGYNIAIDGPSASGKTEVSTRLSEKLGITVVDSGAIYRAVTLFCLNNDIDITNEKVVVENLKNIDVKLDGNNVFLNNIDVSFDIRKNEVSIATSTVAKYPKVREFVISIQRITAGEASVVMQGRDIGSVVLPNAELKIYLNAALDVRAKRRQMELEQKGEKCSFEEVRESIIKRDNDDIHRKNSPLIKAKDAIEIDTSNLTVEEVIDKIINLVKERGLK